MFHKISEVPCNYGTLPVFYQGNDKNKYWLSIKDVINVITYHQKTNTMERNDGEMMISMGLALQLLFKMEMEDFTIGTTINALNQLYKT